MSDNSAIEWTDATWNPIRARNLKTGKVGWHCEHATTGCELCYAEGFNKRLGTGLAFKPGHRADIEIFLDEEMLTQPLRWKKPRTIFVCSMTDLFADFVPVTWIERMLAVMDITPHHTYQVLTKRAERMCSVLSDPTLPARLMVEQGRWPLPNLWAGVSAERQEEWDERKEHLAATPAAVRFASFEPLLGGIVEPRPMSDFLHWAICGGESGPKARPMHPDWARSLRDQCAAAGVAFFFKQWGENIPCEFLRIGDDGEVWRQDANGKEFWFFDEMNRAPAAIENVRHSRVGKKKAGRTLDGAEYSEMPVRP